MAEFHVIFYEKTNGEIPVEAFILQQDPKTRAKLLGLLKILEENGNLLREPYSKHLTDGIFELRSKTETATVRVLYFFYHQGNIVLTNGFIKKSQKTPVKEIMLAKNRRKDYMERMERL